MSAGHISTEELLNAAAHLPPVELKQLISRLLVLNARHQSPVLPADESQLLLKINRALPHPLQQRYQALRVKRDAETLSETEYSELLQLTEQTETFAAERMEALAKLAKLRGQSLIELMAGLGIQGPQYD